MPSTRLLLHNECSISSSLAYSPVRHEKRERQDGQDLSKASLVCRCSMCATSDNFVAPSNEELYVRAERELTATIVRQPRRDCEGRACVDWSREHVEASALARAHPQWAPGRVNARASNDLSVDLASASSAMSDLAENGLGDPGYLSCRQV